LMPLTGNGTLGISLENFAGTKKSPIVVTTGDYSARLEIFNRLSNGLGFNPWWPFHVMQSCKPLVDFNFNFCKDVIVFNLTI
jgi:hypothetical protein